MRDLTPIKVKIKLKKNGQHDYPNFNTLPSVSAAMTDWSRYIDVYGDGWHYDKCCGHEVDTVESPHGEQFGAILVPKAFADEAVLQFPDRVSILTEAEFEAFFNTHAHAHESDEQIDVEALQGIRLKQEMNIPLTAHQLKAIDPNDDTPGIRKNKRKVWSDYKGLKGIQIK